MIQDFIASWELFQNTYLAGWLIAALLPLAGLQAGARNQVFTGLALSEAGAFGVATGLLLGEKFPFFEGSLILSALAMAFSIGASLFIGRSQRPGRESPEALTGWVYLAASSGAILLLARNPHGLEELQRLMISSIIGASATDVGILAAMLVATAAFAIWKQDLVLLMAIDPAMAPAVGIRRRKWEIFAGAWLGMTVGYSLRTAGMLYTFGCLVLPYLAAKNLCRETRSLLLAGPVISVGAAMTAFVLAQGWDLPPGQATVGLLAGLVVVGWMGRK